MAVRLVVPAGYMPAALGSGGFLMLCPAGMPSVPAKQAHGHGHDHRPAMADHRGPTSPDSHHALEDCALGEVLNLALALAPEVRLGDPPVDATSVAGTDVPSAFGRWPTNAQARAPPLV